MWETYLVFVAITTILFVFILGVSESGDAGLQNFGTGEVGQPQKKRTALEAAGIKPLQTFD